jgi:diguanylate cyclase (GGDEF)-like protein
MNDSKKINILIVDDRPENIFALSEALGDPELNIFEATSGNEALSLVLNHDFALILMDVQMPEMDGFETAELLRGMKETMNIPIIFVTAINKEKKYVFKGYDVGAVDYLFKPVNIDILNSKVRIFVDLYRQKIIIKKQASSLKKLAFYDPLTQLPNRTLFFDRFNQALIKAKRNKSIVSLLSIDIDRFKNVNDTFGHDVGDLLLKEVAQRLTCLLRSSDTIARMGGDEFAVIITDISTIHNVSTVAQKAINLISKPFHLNDYTCSVGASIGIALFPSDADNIEQLTKNADIAMYHAKNKGRNNFQFYTNELNSNSIQRLSFENDLHKAIENKEFELYYQPIYSNGSKQITSLEALIRWNHPSRGFLVSGDFIPLAEETGYIREIGHWVTRQACKQIKKWKKIGIENRRISINISAQQFGHKDEMKSIARLIKEEAVSTDCFELELTENCILENEGIAAKIMNELRDAGLHHAIDDFGTGYSSLKFIKQLPFNKIKIDRSFIKNIAVNEDDAAIVNAMIAMAHSLKLKVVAEGVETKEQLNYLDKLGCDEIQGYLLSTPLPSQEIEKLLLEEIALGVA